jgi:hypothetical protein
MQDLPCDQDIFAIKMDDLTQSIFYQPGLKENVQEIICLSFTMLGSYVKGSK